MFITEFYCEMAHLRLIWAFKLGEKTWRTLKECNQIQYPLSGVISIGRYNTLVKSNNWNHRPNCIFSKILSRLNWSKGCPYSVVSQLINRNSSPFANNTCLNEFLLGHGIWKKINHVSGLVCKLSVTKDISWIFLVWEIVPTLGRFNDDVYCFYVCWS